ncbi:MAG: TlpA family protein disulfide reductase [Rickettsiales bacterium]|nr:TlpA family protein disulfide reductase [Rickettsiales bacterium]
MLGTKDAYAKNKNQNLVIKTLQDENFDLSKMRGKVVIVNFWAYWCSNCVREMEILEILYQKYHNQGLEIIGVSVDKKSQIQKILERVKNLSYQNSVLSDAAVNDFPEIEEIPQNYVFDKNGELVDNVSEDDLLTKEGLDKLIKSLL